MKIALIPNDFSMDLEAVFQLCQEEHVQYVELGYMWDKSILDLSPEEENQVAELLQKYNLKVASIQSTSLLTISHQGNQDQNETDKSHALIY